MDAALVLLCLLLLGLIALDLLALRFGVDSRHRRASRRDWW